MFHLSSSTATRVQPSVRFRRRKVYRTLTPKKERNPAGLIRKIYI